MNLKKLLFSMWVAVLVLLVVSCLMGLLALLLLLSIHFFDNPLPLIFLAIFGYVTYSVYNDTDIK